MNTSEIQELRAQLAAERALAEKTVHELRDRNAELSIAAAGYTVDIPDGLPRVVDFCRIEAELAERSMLLAERNAARAECERLRRDLAFANRELASVCDANAALRVAAGGFVDSSLRARRSCLQERL